MAAACLFGLGIASQFGFVERPFSLPPVQTEAVVSEAEVQPALDLSEAFVNVAEVVTPAVVQIETTRQTVRSGNRLQGLERFFRGGPRGDNLPDIVEGSGSGFIIAEDGYVLTNNHVVEDAQQITVTLLDGREFGAEVVGTDPTTDIAVIKIDGTDLPVASLGSSAEVRVGEWVLAWQGGGATRPTSTHGARDRWPVAPLAYQPILRDPDSPHRPRHRGSSRPTRLWAIRRPVSTAHQVIGSSSDASDGYRLRLRHPTTPARYEN